jgi:glycosyltransferase involved in cell wall biosynthesis
VSARLSVLLCTEGTYPFVGGGVSTWCDLLCRELDDVDFTVWAITGEPEVEYRYTVPDNVREVVHLPLWGTDEPAQFILADVPFAEILRRRRATTPAVVEQEFVPLLRRLLRAIDGAGDALEQGRLFVTLWHYFQRYDWKHTWRSEPAWNAFVDEALRPYRGETAFLEVEEPSVHDLTTAMRWLYNYLIELNAPVPRVDLVHTTIAAFAGLAGVIAKVEHGTPLLATDHGVWVRERYIALADAGLSPYGKRFLTQLSALVSRVVYAYADVVSPVTNFNRRWEEPWGVEPTRIQTIPNAVDPQLFLPRPKPPHTAGRPVVVAAARLFPLKDIETMIRAADVVRRSIPDVEFLLYGALDADPPYVERCRALVAELSLESTFRFCGHHPNPVELYAEGDLTALSSISEAFPYTVLESMSCARPVVGTDVGGVREALQGFGVVVAPRDPEAFGAAVVMLLQDDALRVELGRRGRDEVLARYRISQAIDAYRSLYGRLTAEGRAAA